MKNQPKSGAINPVVTVDKKYGREVLVGIVDAQRMIAHGFDVDYPTSVHFRTLRHGPFSVLIGAKDPCEIRVMLDGELLLEQRLDPNPKPALPGMPSGVRGQVAELMDRPQPFFLTQKADGSPLMFVADPQGRSQEERIKLQLMRDTTGVDMENPSLIRQEEPVGINEAVADLTPEQLAKLFPNAPQAKAVPADAGAGVAAATIGEEPVVTKGDAEVGSGEAVAPARVVPASAGMPTDQGEAPSDYKIENAPLPLRWAPSHGLVAIGVRMIQQVHDGEPPMPPDGFDYILFQLNDFKDNAKVRANMHTRVLMPPKSEFKEIADADGNFHEGHQHLPHVECGGIHPRNFLPRRK